MEAGLIDYRQIILPRNKRDQGLKKLLELTIEEIKALGPITIFDFTIQGLFTWTGNLHLQESVFFTFRHDDLVDKKIEKATIKKAVVQGDRLQLVHIQLSNDGGAYDYASLLQGVLDTCEENKSYKLGSIYFDHKMEDNAIQLPFFALTFIK
ncbi:MAG TPA: hypothetical protein VFH06_02245 [Candidatus Saccharimonadales bacterium]|nr:hypothetical protein [Candidatus Saccharimonadales bacterium]